ncbi:MAG: ImmA/IrrE family metallo-endopeptidase [Xanthobacteraceae bacterium]|nr:ImmA/IrrE family metallo-endopeptidase [Xanthobacteraceae bacterium]
MAHALNKLADLYPKFRLKVVADADLPKMEAKAYSAAFMLKVREGVMKALKTYGDPRSRFTVGHELGHLFLGHPGNQPRERPGQKISSTQAVLEDEANLFASEFLVPTHLLHPDLSAGDISRLFQVSLDAATHRKRRFESKPVENPATQDSQILPYRGSGPTSPSVVDADCVRFNGFFVRDDEALS